MQEKSRLYTITLDDDPVMYKIIAKLTGLPSLPFSKPDKLLARADSYEPLAIFVDIHLDLGISGIEYLAAMRQHWPFTPIFIITSDPEDALVSQSLAAGANDFIRKPLAAGEVTGRLQARLAEMQAKRGQEEIQINDVVFNSRLGTLHKAGKCIYLPRMEADIFLLLSQNIGMTLTREALRRRIWGTLSVSENALDKKLSTLRKALKELESQVQLRSHYGAGVSMERQSHLGFDEGAGAELVPAR